MGTHLMDIYSVLHFTSGVLIEKLGIGFVYAFVLHLIFEYLENTTYGVYMAHLMTKITIYSISP